VADLETDTPDAVKQKALVDLYLDIINSGEKYPVEEWDDAAERYGGYEDPPDREHLDSFRSQVDTQKSYLDQLEGNIRATPAAGMAIDEIVAKQAQCSEGLVQYAFRELALRRVCGRALLSSLMGSAGAAVDSYDERRALPIVKWINTRQVAWDKDSAGDITRGGWVAFYEWVSPDVLWAQSEGKLDLKKLRDAANKQPKTHTGDVLKDAISGGPSEPLRRRCLLWRFFGRNEYALYSDRPADDPLPGDKGEAEWTRFRTAKEPRRYLELVDGYDVPLADEPDWPREFALDFDQWPVHWLTFNEDLQHVAGFTDWRHVQRANDANENMARAITTNAKASLALKYLLRKNAGVTREDVEAFLKTNNPAQVLEGLVDDQGNPLLTPVQVEQFRQDLLEAAQFLQDKADGAAHIDEILRGMQGKTNQTATEIGARQEAAMTSTNSRLRKYEEFEEDVARRWLEMAYATMPRASTIRVATLEAPAPPVTPMPGAEGAPPVTEAAPPPAEGEAAPAAPEVAPAEPVLVLTDQEGVPWSMVAQILTANPGSEITRLGVDAIVGEELAQFWPEGQPLDVIRRNVRVYVEAGSTTRQARMEKVQILTELYTNLLLPLYQIVGRMDLAAQFVKIIVAKAGGDDATALVPDPQELLAAQQAQAAAQAAALAAGGKGGQGGSAPPAGGPPA
jgi:hypothetical protein